MSEVSDDNRIQYLPLKDRKAKDSSQFAVPLIYDDDTKPLYCSSDYSGKEIISFITNLFFDIKMDRINNDDTISRERAISLAIKLIQLWELVVAEDMALPYTVFWYCMAFWINGRESLIDEFENYLDNLLENHENRLLVCCAPLDESFSDKKPVFFELDSEWQKYLDVKDKFRTFEEYLYSRNPSHYDWWPDYIRKKREEDDANIEIYNSWLSEAFERGDFNDDI